MILEFVQFEVRRIMDKSIKSLQERYSFRSMRKKIGDDKPNEKNTLQPLVEESSEIIKDRMKKKNNDKPAKSPELSGPSKSNVKIMNQRKRNPISITYEGSVSKKDKWEPDNWNIILDNIREMRKGMDAPVDTMGCDISLESNLSPEVRRYQVLISLMLSSQTKDEVNFAAMEKLRNHGLTVENILRTDDDVLGNLIYPVSFWKNKVKYIKKTTKILKEKFKSDIPNTVEELCTLPGVGPKMAHLAMNCGWGIITGIGVDTHVHRISNRLHWVRKQTKTPEATRKELEAWLPKELWKEVNHLLVGFGQTICKPVKPGCVSCLNKTICPSSLVK